MGTRVRRMLLPVGTFIIVLAVHYVWIGLFPERDPAQDRWLSVPAAETSWLRRYREQRLCAARNLAIGGVTLSGFLAIAGCFLLGCCGSPMLAVYLSLFGASFLPFARPFVAGVTTITIIVGWFSLNGAEVFPGWIFGRDSPQPKKNPATQPSSGVSSINPWAD